MTVGTARPKSLTKSIDGEGHTTYTATYDVLLSVGDESIDDVSVADGVPRWGDSLSFGNTTNQNAFCNAKTAGPVEIEDSHKKRVVTCTFSTKSGRRSRSANNVIQNPIYEPWKKGGSFATGTRVTGVDKDGAPIYTTGLEQKYFEIPDGYDTLHLEGPSLRMSLSQRAQALLRCNEATIWGLTARQVVLAQWQWEELFHGNTSYFYHRMEFWIKYAGWNEVWHNAGTQEYRQSNQLGERIVPILENGERLVKFLDEDGMVIPENQIPGNVVTKTTEIIPEFDFTQLTGTVGMPSPTLPGNFI